MRVHGIVTAITHYNDAYRVELENGFSDPTILYPRILDHIEVGNEVCAYLNDNGSVSYFTILSV
jgi:hypothetical protein